MTDNCSEGIEFVNDIREATKFSDKKDALWVKHNYEERKNNSCDSGFQIIPLKITYEW